MLTISYTGQFKKDYKLCMKRGYDKKRLQDVINILAIPESLPLQNKELFLTGNYRNKKECHITPDWLLIYRTTDTELILYRTGTHSDLFNK